MMNFRGLLFLQMALLLGCQSVNSVLPSGSAPERAPTRLARPVVPGTNDAGAPGAGSVLSNNGGALVGRETEVSNNGATLFGALRVPAPILSDQGGSLTGTGPVRDASAGVIQVPLADVPVQLLDAGAQPLLDAAGNPLVARTDAAGNFRFDTPLPERNIIVSAPLAAGRGTLLAVATRDSRSIALEVDLFSTLSTAYIVEKFVATQQDRQQTLDRLPGEVARETRKQAEVAFREARAQVPPSLDQQAMIATAEALKAEISAFEQQLETVRRLLILAGQSNLGEGRLATTVALEFVGNLNEGPDGSLYFRANHKLMRVRPDGTLVTLMGGGALPLAEADGQPGTAVDFIGSNFLLDEAGQVLVYRDKALYRLEASGTLRYVRTLPPGLPVGVRGDDSFLVDWNYLGDEPGGSGTPTGLAFTVWRATAGGEPVQLAAFESTAGLQPGIRALVPGEGIVVEVPGRNRLTDARWIDLDTGAVSRVEAPAGARWSRTDSAGHLVYAAGADDQQRLWVLPRGAAAPADFGAWSGYPPSDVLLARDGQSVLVNHADYILRHTREGQRPVAGLAPEAEVSENARDLALSEPMGLAVSQGGDLWLVDNRPALGKGRLLRIEPSGQVHEMPVTNPDLEYRLSRNQDVFLRPLGADGVAVLTGKANVSALLASILEIRKDGSTHVLFNAPAGYVVEDFAPAENGALRVMLAGKEAPHRLVEQAADGTLRTLFEAEMTWEDVIDRNGAPARVAKHAPDLRGCNLAPAPWGELFVYGQARLAAWSAEGGFEVLADDPAFTRKDSAGVAATVGPDGAFYYIPSWNEVLRWDPVTGADTVVAGARGPLFNGSGLDDGLGGPRDLAFTPEGELAFIDGRSRQVRRIPRDKRGGIPIPKPANN